MTKKSKSARSRDKQSEFNIPNGVPDIIHNRLNFFTILVDPFLEIVGGNQRSNGKPSRVETKIASRANAIKSFSPFTDNYH